MDGSAYMRGKRMSGCEFGFNFHLEIMNCGRGMEGDVT